MLYFFTIYLSFTGKIEEGLDKAVMTMKKGEEAIVKISSDFYYGCEVGGRNSSDSLFYEIKLVDFTKVFLHDFHLHIIFFSFNGLSNRTISYEV